ncbi:abc transporter c family member 10 [Quercus suber]|uniref:ABC-type xenobiotic transporter n=1 Tax=Quercus suber TaxID=58331 RepID=A0AAW0JN50_QUESU
MFSVYTYKCILVCNTEVEEQRENKKMKGDSDSVGLVTPFAKAGFLSRMSFWWLNPLMKGGRKKTLEDEDIPKLREAERAEICYFLFLEQLNKQKQKDPSSKTSILKAIALCHWKEILFSGCLALLYVLTLSTGPLLLNAFILAAEIKESFMYEGYVLAISFFFLKCIQSMSERHWYFRSRLIGLKVRSLLIAAIYNKQLRLSNSARLIHSGGEIMNYVTMDAYRIGEFPYWLHQTWTTCLQLCIAIVILFHAVGLATIAAMLVIILTMICNIPLAKLQHKFQSKLTVAQDERLKACSEALVNMKVLKLYAWENHFKNVIEYLRKVEYKWLRKVQLEKAYHSLLFWSTPVLVSCATFGACYFLRIPLHANNVFTFVATFRLVQEPIALFPDVIGVVIQAKVAFARIVKFLEAPELQNSHVQQICNMESVDHSIFINSAEFSWEENLSKPTLRDLNLEVRLGEKVAVCGEVGSGKSALLAAILGEVPKIQGTIKVYGKISYVSQTAWIQSGTIQDNILFGSAMDSERYKETLERCSLVKDLELLPFGDLTEIGERGVNLSGGQKQHIQLARALYQDADVFLLDDPFSALDAQTAMSIFNEYVIGALSKKTVLLVTHQVDFLPEFNSVLLMSDGKILQEATYNQLLASNKEFQDLVNAHKETAGSERLTVVSSTSRQGTSSREIRNIYVEKELQANEIGDTGFKPYKQYLNQNKGFLYFFIACLSQLIFVVSQILQNSWMAANVDNPRVSTLRLVRVYLLIGLAPILCILCRTLSTVALGLKSSKSLFSQLLDSLFRAPMSFYDSTPLGRILSRRYYFASAKELMRINGTTKSLVANHLAESAAGAMTIRAFEKEDLFFKKNLGLIDTNASPFFHCFSANEWLVQWIEIVCAMVLASAALCMVLLPRRTFSAGFIGMALSYGLSLNMMLVRSIQKQCTVADNIISVERLNQYMHIPSEAPEVIEGNCPTTNWPAVGKVEIQDLQVRYRPNAPLVLCGISCTFEGGQKIGIVGRTGSGKTTLIGALFRLVEPAGGKIIVDGIDISTIGLHDLRSRFGIIPQDPTLFNGTVRFNLDPMSQHSDQEIWEVLGKCQLQEALQANGKGLDSLESGSNWSMGQRQLFCLGRAILRRSKILVLDEATASIDNATDMIL